MKPPYTVLHSSYDYLQVALSVLISVAASYAALDLAGRVKAACGRRRVVWLAGGAGATGIGIWAMHYVGMLAFRLPVTVRYHWPTVLLSLSIAVVCSLFALLLVIRPHARPIYFVTGSIALGGGIAGLHYVAMAAMRLEAVSRFDPIIVALSVLLAIVFSMSALWLAWNFRDEPKGIETRKVGSALIMGAAISAMHYTGMAAASFFSSDSRPNLSHVVDVSSLGTVGIGIVTLTILGLAILTCSVERRLEAQKLELALSQAKLEMAHLGRVAMLGELTASMAHEINQPLANIAMSASASLYWLEMQPPKLAEARKAIAKALEEVNRGKEIVSRIRALLKKGPSVTDTVNINDIIGEVLSLMSNEFAKTGVQVRAELTTVPAPVRGDRIQLQQVLLNLFMNAIEAMSSSNQTRNLIVRSSKNEDKVLVQVEDSGLGLPPGQADQVFQSFYTTKQEGLGMGLSISRSIVESHGGHLSVRRKDPHGAVFEFTLPAADDQMQSSDPP